ncbi:MAG: hypothetical protein DDT30_01196 [Dehalococcoidia bacterium]|nr:hypothetical protein [Bacillota bacterium]MBT9140618.1 hypothetical protein [Bacillota bacterium]
MGGEGVGTFRESLGLFYVEEQEHQKRNEVLDY